MVTVSHKKNQLTDPGAESQVSFESGHAGVGGATALRSTGDTVMILRVSTGSRK